MHKFIDLTIDEMNRNKSYYLIFLTLLIVGEIFSIGYGLYRIRDMIDNKSVFGVEEVIRNKATVAVIFAGILGLVLFTLISWMREWRLQGRFMYRLLTLPGSRLTIAWSKWASMMIKGLGMIAVQTFLFILTNMVLDVLFQSYQNVGFKAPLAMDLQLLNIIMPVNFLTFMLLMLLLSSLVIFLSNTQILWFSYVNRSKWKTVLYTLIYIAMTIVIAFGSFLWIMKNYNLLENERMWIFLMNMILVNLLQGTFMSRLMKYHISI